MAENDTLEQKRVFAEEAAVVDAQILLHGVMERKGVSRADLARAMNVSRARVTQIFSDECSNLTIRLLARALWALGEELALFTDSDVAGIREESQIFAAAASLNDWGDALWVEIHDHTPPCVELSTANDNVFDGLSLVRENRDAYEEMAA